MKITSLEVRNVKAIKYVKISPREGTTVVAGPNAQGKCLPEGSPVCLWNGSRKAIQDIRETDLLVGLDSETWCLQPEHPLGISTSGVQDVFSLRTRGGYQVEATANHRLLAPDGWKPLQEFSVGHHIAIPLRLPTGGDNGPGLSCDEAMVLGLLIGDGCLTHGVHLSVANPEIAEVFKGCVSRLWPGLVMRKWSQGKALRVTKGTKSGKRGGPHLDFLEKHGLRNIRSRDKFVPEAIYNSGIDAIKSFVAGLVMTDGWIAACGSMQYYTRSKLLSHGMKSLLLRLGIPSTLRVRMIPPRAGGIPEPFYCVTVVTYSGHVMVQQVLLPLVVASKIKARQLTGKRHFSSSYSLPPYVADLFQNAGGKELSTWVRGRHALSRDRFLQAMATCPVKSPELSRFYSEDIGWDRIEEVLHVGAVQTFDLQMPSEAFFANDFLVHNSSLIDSIAFVLGGKKLMPKDPLRDGEDSGEIKIDLTGDEETLTPPLQVVRVFDRDKDGHVHSELYIRDVAATGEEEALAAAPQKMLDDKLGRVNIRNRPIGFDPTWFLTQKPAEQASVLRGLIDFDFEQYELERKQLYDHRQSLGRDGKVQAGILDGIPFDQEVHDAGNVALDEEALQAEHQKRLEQNKNNQEKRQVVAADQGMVDMCQRGVDEVQRRVQAIKEQLKREEANLAEHQRDLAKAKESLASSQEKASTLVDADVNESLGMLSGVRSHNQSVEMNLKRMDVESKVNQLRDAYQADTYKIDALDAERDRAMSEADFGVEGLTFGEEGVLFKGRPLTQASSKEAINLSVAIGCALHPTLNLMLVRNGSLLDPNGIKELVETVARMDAQCFLEIVAGNDTTDCDIRISEGEADYIHPDVQNEEEAHAAS